MNNPLHGIPSLQGQCPSCGWTEVSLTTKQPDRAWVVLFGVGWLALVVFFHSLLATVHHGRPRQPAEVMALADAVLNWSQAGYVGLCGMAVTALLFPLIWVRAAPAMKQRLGRWPLAICLVGAAGLALLDVDHVLYRWSKTAYFIGLAITISVLVLSGAACLLSFRRRFVCKQCGRMWRAE